MKIYFNEKPKGSAWGGGNHVLLSLVQFLKKKGYQIVFKLEKELDLIFIQANSKVRYKERIKPLFKYKKKHPNVKILHRINVSDISKNTSDMNDLVLNTNSLADDTIFISRWLADYYIENGFDRSYHVIYNGCNRNYFYPLKEKILEDPIRLVTHHWSDNWMKGFDIYTKLDELIEKRDDMTFTYIGRYNKNYNPKNTKLIPPLYGKELGDELRKYDIYLTAARWEACGMHHIEGACCGLPVLYHSEGGGVNESCQNYGIEYNNVENLIECIYKLKESYQEFREKITYDFLSSERCNEEYYKVIQEMFE
ncbi:MAG: glycosyltransferase [Candidatus Hodarchaeota archaeon]